MRNSRKYRFQASTPYRRALTPARTADLRPVTRAHEGSDHFLASGLSAAQAVIAELAAAKRHPRSAARI